MKIKKHICFALVLITVFTQGIAQHALQYNLNSQSGLPSNNAYCIFKDDLGYLWLGTEKGVVKYNGYVSQLYDASTGLKDADVWDFFQDSRKRIWLSRISDEIGYMYNGVYHKARSTFNSDIYPKYIRENEKGIMFSSISDNKIYLGYEENDNVEIDELMEYTTGSGCFIAPDNKVYCRKGNVLYQITKGASGYVFSKKCKADNYPDYAMLGGQLLPMPGNVVNEIILTDVNTCKERKINFAHNEMIYNHYGSNNKFYIITHSSVYVFDTNMNMQLSLPLTTLLATKQLENNQVAYLSQDSLWGNSIATTKSGVYLSFDTLSFAKVHSDLARFKYLGNDKYDISYWWSEENRTFSWMDTTGKTFFKRFNHIDHVESVLEYSRGKILLFTQSKIELLNKQTMSVLPLYDGIKYSICDDSTDPALSFAVSIDNNLDNHKKIYWGGQSGVRMNDSTIRCIIRGKGYVNNEIRGDTLIKTIIAPGKYKDITYVPAYNSYIVYNDHDIIVHVQDTLLHIGEVALNLSGITRIERIRGDKNGNIFIKDYNNLYCYSPGTGKFTRQLKGYVLGGAVINILGDILIVAGKFGVLFAQIMNDGNLAVIKCIANTKGLVYNTVNDLVSAGSHILINTDKGLLKLKLPQPHDNISSKYTGDEQHYRIVLKNDNRLCNIDNGDTIILSNTNTDIQFDIVRPAGVGVLKFAIYMPGRDDHWKKLNSNELHLAGIPPGEYNRLVLKLSDDIWESSPIRLVVYRTPTFWQTRTGTILIWAGLTVLLFFIMTLLVYYTRHIVSKRHLERNHLLSLKLKSIYAQINPHFIFNTLNTGLYFIKENKNEKAFTHISSFSQLLRSYIKSSRNKFITLAEEIENLENYLTLQQYRFEDVFSYEIEKDEHIDATVVLLPSMLLQPFVENAINHGLINKKEHGWLSIKFISDNKQNEITCIIDDNGIGRQRSAELNRNNPYKPESYGSELISDLIKIINDDKKIFVSIKYIDKQDPDTGTTVIITIKKLYHAS